MTSNYTYTAFVCTYICCVIRKKTSTQSFCYNSVKSWPVFKILSLSHF